LTAIKRMEETAFIPNSWKITDRLMGRQSNHLFC